MQSFTLTIYIITALVPLSLSHSTRDPDLGKNFTELVKSKGFVPEEHYVITEDQYIMGVFRVRCRKHCCAQKVVYISTPLWMDSDSFVADYANNSLAFLLADSGYDVWIGNIRGTKYSRAKVGNPNPSSFDLEFFDYTFLDIGLKDIPAGINYTLKVTGQDRLFYIGHSQATAGVFALLSRQPEFNKKIIAMAAMCPFRRISCDIGQKEQHGILQVIAHNYKALTSLRKVLGEFPPTTKGLSTLCYIVPELCDASFHFSLGETPNLNSSRLEVYMQFIPAATSVKNILFFAQMSTRSCSGDYDVYDFDYDAIRSKWGILSSIFSPEDTNMKRYGTRRPPSFAADAIQVPVKLYHAEDDGYATPDEVARLEKELPNYRGSWDMGPRYGHYDLIMPTYNKTHVLDAIQFLDSFADACAKT